MSSEDGQNKREVRSFLMARDPSIDRRCRPRPEKKIRLFGEITEDDESCSETSTDDEQTATEEEESIPSSAIASEISEIELGALVYLRLRPVDMPSNTYTISNDGSVLVTRPPNETTTSTNKSNMEKHYTFSAIFDRDVGQRDVYKKCIGQKINDEESFTVMTYGTSGSGKTFTLLGDEVCAGIIPRALENIFTLYAANIYPQPSLKLVNARLTIMADDATAVEDNFRRRIFAACPDVQIQHRRLQKTISEDHGFETKQLSEVSVFIWVSFVEIYNELSYDLLELITTNGNSKIEEAPRKNLKIVCNQGKVFIKGLTSVYVKNSSEALKLLYYGLQRLTYGSTSINSHSSRSHCVFVVDVLKFHRSGESTQTSYKFCDLAGSERLDKTGNIGSRLKEAQRINTSLMVLGRCLVAASTARKKSNDLIPYRESKLTMLLQSALLGKEKLAMIVNVTPMDKFYEENLNALNFASIAKNIVFKQPPIKPKSSRYSAFMEYSKAGELQDLLEENNYLRAELERTTLALETAAFKHAIELQEQEIKLRNTLTDSFQETLQSKKELYEEQLRQELHNQKRIFEAMMATQQRRYEEQIEDLRDEIDDLKENEVIEVFDEV